MTYLTSADKKPMPQEFPIRLFVYGTLKRGFGNNKVLGESRFVANGSIQGLLLDLGTFPGFISATGVPPVMGELWDVPDQATLDRLDQLEGADHGFYNRKKGWVVAQPELAYDKRTIGPCFAHVYEYGRYKDKEPARICWPSEWNGPRGRTRYFAGFHTDKDPVMKTEAPVIAHYKNTDTGWSGLVWADTGQIEVIPTTLTTKPHFKYNIQTRKWDLVTNVYQGSSPATPMWGGHHGHRQIPHTPPTPPKPLPVEFKDDSDPGEEDAPEHAAA